MTDLNFAPSLWVVALWAEYPMPEQWRSWADTVIEKGDAPDDWLIKLSLAKGASQALECLLSVVNASSIQSNEQLIDSGIGYFWMKYQSSQTDLKECLRGAGRYADQYDASVDCEYFFSLLNELDSGENIEEKARDLFAPYQRLAERNWKTLMGC